ncbi:MAG: hypothetical protein K6G79_05765 [Bacteroidales bacterium]|nr:hypothetical protein [Bacteroidales bacterium]
MKRIIILLAAALLLLSGCRPEIDFVAGSPVSGQAEVSLSAGTLSVTFPSDGGTASVDLQSNGKWEAFFVNGRADGWCSLSTSSGRSGTVNIQVSAISNPDYDQRSATITFHNGEAQCSIRIVQKQKDALIMSDNRVEMGQPGGRFELSLRHNVPFSFTVSDNAKGWIKSLSTKGLAESSLSFEVTANDSVERREGSIQITSDAGSETVTVYQEGEEPSLVLTDPVIEMESGKGAFQVQVRHNVPVDFDLGTCDWIHEVSTKSLSTDTYGFVVDPNESFLVRVAEIVFSNAQWNLQDTVRVSQTGFPPILASHDTLSFPSFGAMRTFRTVGSDPDELTVAVSDRWLWLKSHEVEKESVRFGVYAQEYEGDQPRLGSVRVWHRERSIPDSLVVRQWQRFPYFSFTTKAGSVTVPRVGEGSPLGFIYWGDGTDDDYADGCTHTYAEEGQHTVIVEISDKKEVSISGLEDGMQIDFSKLRK